MRSDSPQLEMLHIAGLDLAVWVWPGEGTPLIFVHATGFHARCWDEIIRRLPGRYCIAVDLRGHGRSAKPEPPYPWRHFGHDVAEIAGRLGITGALGIGHSMGGHSVVTAALLRPEIFNSLILIDPTIFPPDRYGEPPFEATSILRRRNFWNSPQDMFDRYSDREPFAAWRPEVLRDYCEYGLIPEGTGYVLACPPAVEASIYPLSVAAESNLHPELSLVTQPTLVVRAGRQWQPGVFDLSTSPTDPGLAGRLPHARDLLLPGRSHFIPMELPDFVAELITSSRTDPRDAHARL